MSATAQADSFEPFAFGEPASDPPVPEAAYHVVQQSAAPAEQLYSFRQSMSQPEQAVAEAAAPQAATSSVASRVTALVAVVAVLAGAALLFLAVPKLLKPKPPAQYVDMGNRRFDPAGLGGRLIARWDGSPKYQLFIDPLDQQDVGGFEAVAKNPPHPLSVVIRLRDASGVIVCQKAITFPPLGQAVNTTGNDQALEPRATASGDSVQNVSGEDGRIDEMIASGTLPCSLNAYQHLSEWDFSASFPSVAGQRDWLRQANSQPAKASNSGGRGGLPLPRLSGPIERDDVIVGDNPSRGTVDTGGGQIFLVGANGLRSRGAEWQVFPAAIHFRCDKNGVCILTRINSHATLQARLLK